MGSVTADFELMTNYIAALPVPAGAAFKTVLDENRRPMVLSLSSHQVPKLQFIRTGVDGIPVVIDVRDRLNLPAATIIQAFGIVQANDLTLYMVVGYKSGSASSALAVVRPFAPADVMATVSFTIIPGATSIGFTQSIYMTPVNTLASNEYPVVFVVHKNLNQTVSWGSDITEVTVRDNFIDWQPSNRMNTPENVTEVLSIAPAANVYGKGLFVLYKSGGQSKLYARFLRPDPLNPGSTSTFVTSVACPTDAVCIASLWDYRNRSALLIGGPEGIRYLTPAESVVKTSPGTLISTDAIVKNVTQLTVAQDSRQVSMWFRNKLDELCYLRATTDKLDQGVVSKLLPAGQASSFAPCIAQPDSTTGNIAWQMLVANDELGNLTLLEQALDTGIWRRTPFYTPSNTDNVAVQSYTITILTRDQKGNPVKNGSVFVAATSSVSLIQNGRHAILPKDGDWYTLDSSGALHLIVACDTLASQNLTVSGLQNSDGATIPVTTTNFNPASKAMTELNKRMESVRTAADLRAVKTQKGESLLPASAGSDETLTSSIKALNDLKGVYQDLPADGTSSTAAKNRAAGTDAPPAADSTPLAQKSSGTLAKIKEAFWDAWHWVKTTATKIWDWVVQKANDVWHFVVNIAGEIKRFVLDCVEKVGEVVTFVFNKVKAGILQVIDWIGWIFSWGDILETKDTISSVITAGLELGASTIDNVANKADAMFAGMINQVDKFMSTPQGAKSISGGSGSAEDKDKSVGNCTSSTKFNWAGERLKNGGAGKSARVETTVTKDSPTEETFSSIFVPAFENVKNAVLKVFEDISNLFTKNGTITVADFMKLGKDVIIVALQTVRGVVTSLLRLVKALLEKIKWLGNAKLNIPIFSALYKLIAQHDLTIFDAISLILAIPTTIFMKIITGNKPPKLPGLNGVVLGRIVIGPSADGQVASPQMKTDFNSLTAGITVSGVLVGTIVHAVKLIYAVGTGGVEETAAVFAGPGKFLETFSIIVDMIGTLHAMPTDASLPGLEYRKWVAYISLIRGAVHLIGMFAGGGEKKEKAMLVFDLLTALTNFGLEQATAAVEFQGTTKWSDYDEPSSIMGTVNSSLNALAAIGYFGAFMMKSDQPEVAAVGLGILEVGTLGMAVMSGVMYKRSYDLGRKTLLIPPSC